MSDDWISDTVGALCDPIIVYESPWMETLPEWIKGEITLQRLALLMVAQKDESQRGIATNAEALAYMYPLSLERPMGHDWTEIYIYLGTQVMSKNMSGRNKDFPEDIAIHSLSDYHMGLLNHLKRWIYERRVRARKDKERAERRGAKEEAKAQVIVEDSYEQLALSM
ncbi:MAG: hypothetical protein KKD44_28530 [Proteobacteria bacterium]|nr:hypothetical protein [Pseudomonadota bacterium]